MDDQQDNASIQCEEEWFNMAIPLGKEFELPNISSPMSPVLIDPNNDLFVPQYQQHDTPFVLDHAFVLDSSHPSGAGNQVASVPVMQTEPSIASVVPKVDQEEHIVTSACNSSVESNLSFPIGNHHIHVPRSTSSHGFESNGTFNTRNQLVRVPSSSSLSRNGLDINLSLRNQRSHVGRSIPLRNSHPHVHKFVDGSSTAPNVSSVTSCSLGGTEEKIGGNNSPNMAKERLLSRLEEEIALKEFSPLDEIMKKGSSQSSKRFRQEENRSSPPCKVMRIEHSSPGEIERNGNSPGRDALQQ